MNKEKIVEQINKWHEESEHKKIVDELLKTPESELDYELKSLLARAYNNLEDYDIAIELLLQIKEEGESDPFWNFRLGFAYYYLAGTAEDIQRAKEYFEKTLALAKEDSPKEFIEDTKNFIIWCDEIIEEHSHDDDVPEPKEVGVSEGGSTIYSYKERESNEFRAAKATDYYEDIEAHMNTLFPERETMVFHEIISDLVHIDVNIMYPNEEDDFYVLYTTGMSAMPMNIDGKFSDEEIREMQYAELMIFLPKDWKIGKGYEITSDMPEEYYWPVRLLKVLARFPHEYGAWFASAHTIPNGPEYEHYADNTKLSCAMLVALNEKLTGIYTKDGNLINMYMVFPIYKEEAELKLKKGADFLLEKIMALDIDNPWIVDIKRKNVATKWPF